MCQEPTFDGVGYGATAAPRRLSHAVSVSTPYPLPPYFCLYRISDEPTRSSPWVLSSNGENAPQLFHGRRCFFPLLPTVAPPQRWHSGMAHPFPAPVSRLIDESKRLHCKKA